MVWGCCRSIRVFHKPLLLPTLTLLTISTYTLCNTHLFKHSRKAPPKRKQPPMSKLDEIYNFFPEFNRDGIHLGWFHRANSPEQLTTAIHDPSILLIEADVIYCEETSRPVMAHPPAYTSNFSLKDFLLLFRKSLNASPPSSPTESSPTSSSVSPKMIRKGIKLDFKSLKAARAAKAIIHSFFLQEILKDKLLIMWLNADILPGFNKDKGMVPGVQFLKAVDQLDFPLSLGWAVPYPCDHENAIYTPEMTVNMTNLIRERTKETAEITIALRAGYLQRSFGTIVAWMFRLWSEDTRLYSITLWHSVQDNPHSKEIVTSIRKLRSYPDIRKDRILYDLPKNLISQII